MYGFSKKHKNEMLKPTIYLIPRWAGNAHSDWYDWAVLQIKAKYDIDIHCLELPHWHEPNPEKSLNYLNEKVRNLDKHSYFIGHSVSCQAILHFINSQRINTKIGGFLFVASWFEVDKPWESLKPWLKTGTLDFSFISRMTNFKHILLSDDDPFTSDFQRNKTFWETNLNAVVKIISKGRHFNESIEPKVLNEIEEMILYALNQ
jgi:Predicted esterase of the alpha/beta hydrolase fold